jgi:hypothetical protein
VKKTLTDNKEFFSVDSVKKDLRETISGSLVQQAIARKRVEETVVISPGAAQEARIQNVEAIVSANSQMTMEQLREFHQQHHALVTDIAKQAEQLVMPEHLLQFQKQ